MASESQTYTLPTTRHAHHPSSRHRESKKPWQPRLSLGHRPHTESEEQLSRETSRVSHFEAPSRADKWWKILFFQGMLNDIKRRAPYYWSDWTDAWDYRVVPATVYMYFAKYVRHKRINPIATLKITFTCRSPLESIMMCVLEQAPPY